MNMFLRPYRPLLFVLAPALLGPAGCEPERDSGLKCGEGTVEVDAECVPETADSGEDNNGGQAEGADQTGGGKLPGGNRTDGAGDDGSNDGGFDGGGTGSSEGTDLPPSDADYGPCYSGSDVECAGSQTPVCMDATCTRLCQRDSDCPAPTSGSAVHLCGDTESDLNVCLLSCRNGLTCPAGMECHTDEFLDVEYCAWPTP